MILVFNILEYMNNHFIFILKENRSSFGREQNIYKIIETSPSNFIQDNQNLIYSNLKFCLQRLKKKQTQIKSKNQYIL